MSPIVPSPRKPVRRPRLAVSIVGIGSPSRNTDVGAIVADVRLSELGSDAIRVDLEHAEGHALAVLLPYTKKKLRRGIEYGQLRAQAGSRRIWA